MDPTLQQIRVGSATSKGVSINATVGLNVAEVRMNGPFEAPASPA